MYGILNKGKQRLATVLRDGTDKGREYFLGSDGAYRWMLRSFRLNDVLEERRYQFLSRFGSVHYFEREQHYLVTSFEEADHILKNDHLFSKIRQTSFDPFEQLLYAQSDRHAKTSALIRPCITKDILNESSAWVRDMSIRVFESLPTGEKFDWHKEYCMPTVYFSTCHIQGFDLEWAEAYFKKVGGNIETAEFYHGFKECCMQWLNTGHVEGDGRLLNTFKKYVAAGVFNREEATELLMLMFSGALKTTASFLAVLSRALMAGWSGIEPMQLLDEQVLTRYVEENLRLCPIVPRIVRRIEADSVLAGISLKKGSLVYIDIRMANRDPKRFSKPDEASFSFNHPRHMTFGSGIHHCIGMPMARHQMKVLLPTLLERIGTVRHITSKWVVDAEEHHFYHPHYFICKRDVARSK